MNTSSTFGDNNIVVSNKYSYCIDSPPFASSSTLLVSNTLLLPKQKGVIRFLKTVTYIFFLQGFYKTCKVEIPDIFSGLKLNKLNVVERNERGYKLNTL